MRLHGTWAHFAPQRKGASVAGKGYEDEDAVYRVQDNEYVPECGDLDKSSDKAHDPREP